MKSSLNTIARRMSYSQYYTRKEISDYICQLVDPRHHVESVIDLGVGEGSLLKSLKNKYSNLVTIGVDIDNVNVDKLRDQNIFNAVHCLDSTKPETTSKIISQHGKFDLVVGNPPYSKIDFQEIYQEQFKELSLYQNSNLSKINTDIIFLLNGLSLLKKDGVLIYILPDSFASNNFYKQIREYIWNNYNVRALIEVPERSFLATEAKTHILVVSRGKSSDYIEVSKLNCDKYIKLSKAQFSERCDFSYHNKPFPINSTKLKSLNLKLIRGNRSKSFLLENNVNFIHTTCFKSFPSVIKNETTELSGAVYAVKGDILIARVGSRVVGKYVLVESKKIYVSDCVIIIRCLDEKTRKKVISSLATDFIKNWISSIRKGVGAKHITIKDLHELPIY
ncbi:N-6 DNA methylase [Vibrio coralliirubri]|uniref:N-6 DNA methylase n=1 Tax=Vibrio coralliirubri TaxID=1516159 RepID=UPI00228385A5|nr:N-6 DNA methylase [Vibrio coralliirubri]MCY9864279.1 N-6 DNA methylase [Vibrio coralliirubri]